MIITFKREMQLRAVAKEIGFKLDHWDNLIWEQGRAVLKFTKKIGESIYYYEVHNTKSKELKVIAGNITNGEIDERELKPTTNFKDFLEHFKMIGLFLGDFLK